MQPHQRWPDQLVGRLRESGIDVGDPDIVAATGWTTDELAAAMDRASFSPPYDLVSLLIGVNNQYRGREVEEYRREFRALLNRAIALADGQPRRVIVLSIPDWSVSPFAAGRGEQYLALAIDRYNAANREEAERAGARYLDVTAASRAAGRAPHRYVADGLHPSAELYAEWAGLLAPLAASILRGA